MKKCICLICAVLLAVSMAGCAKTEISIYDRGLEVIGLMEKAIQSEAYLELMSANNGLRDIIGIAAKGDYSKPRAVYSISFPKDVLYLFSGITEPGDVPEELEAGVNQRLMAALVSQINAAGGVEILAASTMCTIGKTFVNQEITKDVIYLYIFETGSPVAVTFTTGEDNTVSAAANIILYDQFPCGSAEEIREFFGSETMEITEITRK